ncbi:MAG TPA: cysteine desulfurase family protein [Candidatus Kapabacteria bacterium]|nr:cysteine desulfurase family protein [Candidatus Kapabacteria bacterium]
MSEQRYIYLDNNATTQVDPRVLEAMMPYFTKEFANANSTHIFGVQAHEAVKRARTQVADLIGAEPYEIIFTSGATEAINVAIKGIAEQYHTKGKHIVTVATEHSAVLDTCNYLKTKGFEITIVPVNHEGLIDIQTIRHVVRDDTILVSVMLANNETGVIQPIKDIAALAHDVDALFMTDATQAVGKIPIDVDELGIDMLCLSGHKLYAPKGVGGLYIRQRTNRIKIPALLHGGGHERGMRSGTLNVPGIIGLGEAAAMAKNDMEMNANHIRNLRDYLEHQLLTIDNTSINGNRESRLYTTSNIMFRGVDSDAMIMGLSNPEHDIPLIAVSNGSACTSASIEPSHVLTAMGLDEVAAFSSIRFSLGKFNTKKEMDTVIDAVKNVVNTLRAMVN